MNYKDRLIYDSATRAINRKPEARTAPQQHSDEIGVLWAKTSRGGDEYLRGQITLPSGDVLKIVLFASKSTSEGAPAWRIFEARQQEGR